MEHFLGIQHLSKSELDELLDLAAKFKAKKKKGNLAGKTLVTMFFNPSTRTKTSFDIAMMQLGGHTVCLEPGKSSWGMEIKEGAVMDGDAEEHLKEATKVLCRYADALAVRCFPKFQEWSEDKQDLILYNMAKWSDKPVINMETVTHPCQALAMMLTIKEKLKEPKKKKFLLTWAYHPKGLNTAVGNSAGMMASMYGMDVTVANPPGYDLDPYYINIMKEQCKKNGAKFEVVHDQEKAFEGADFVYAKSWGSLEHYGPKFDKTLQDSNKNWIVDAAKMAKTNNGLFSHCLPVRRNIIVTDSVIDSPASVCYDEAENRLHVQKAILYKLLGGK